MAQPPQTHANDPEHIQRALGRDIASTLPTSEDAHQSAATTTTTGYQPVPGAGSTAAFATSATTGAPVPSVIAQPPPPASYSVAYADRYKDLPPTPGLTTPGVTASQATTPGYDLPGGWIDHVKSAAATVTSVAGDFVQEGAQAVGHSLDMLSGRDPDAPGQRSVVDTVRDSLQNLTIHDVTGVGALHPTDDPSLPPPSASQTHPTAEPYGHTSSSAVHSTAAADDTQPTIIDTITEKLAQLPLPGFLASYVKEPEPAPPAEGQGPQTDAPPHEPAIRPQPDKETVEAMGFRTDDDPGFVPNMPGSLLDTHDEQPHGGSAVPAGDLYAPRSEVPSTTYTGTSVAGGLAAPVSSAPPISRPSKRETPITSEPSQRTREILSQTATTNPDYLLGSQPKSSAPGEPIVPSQSAQQADKELKERTIQEMAAPAFGGAAGIAAAREAEERERAWHAQAETTREEAPWQAAPFMNVGSDQAGSLSGKDAFPESAPSYNAGAAAFNPPGTPASAPRTERSVPNVTSQPPQDDKELKERTIREMAAPAFGGVVGVAAAKQADDREKAWKEQAEKARDEAPSQAAPFINLGSDQAGSLSGKDTFPESSSAQTGRSTSGTQASPTLLQRYAQTFQTPAAAERSTRPAQDVARDRQQPTDHEFRKDELPALAAGGMLAAGAADAWESAERREPGTNIPASGPSTTSTAASQHTQHTSTSSSGVRTEDILASQPKKTAAGQPIVPPLSEKHAETFDNLQTEPSLPKEVQPSSSAGEAKAPRTRSRGDELPTLAAGGMLAADAAEQWENADRQVPDTNTPASNYQTPAATTQVPTFDTGGVLDTQDMGTDRAQPFLEKGIPTAHQPEGISASTGEMPTKSHEREELPTLAAGGMLGTGAAGAWEYAHSREPGTNIPTSTDYPPATPGSPATHNGAAHSSGDDILGTQPKKTAPGQPIVQPLSEKHAETFENLSTSPQLSKDVNNSQVKSRAGATDQASRGKPSGKDELPTLAAGGMLGAGAADAWENAKHREPDSNIPAQTGIPNQTGHSPAPPSTTTQSSSADLLGPPPKHTPAGQPIVQPLSEKHADTFSNLKTETQLPKPQSSGKDRGDRDWEALAAGGAAGAGAAEALEHAERKEASSHNAGATQLSPEEVQKNRELAAAAGLATPAGERGPFGTMPDSYRQRRVDEAATRASAGGHPGVLTESDRQSRLAHSMEQGVRMHEPTVVDAHGHPRKLETAAGAAAATAGVTGAWWGSKGLRDDTTRQQNIEEAREGAATGAVPDHPSTETEGAAQAGRTDYPGSRTLPPLSASILGGSPVRHPKQEMSSTTAADPATSAQPTANTDRRQRKIEEAEAFAGGVAGAGALTQAERLRQTSKASPSASAGLPTAGNPRAPASSGFGEVDTPRDERGNTFSYGTATILSSPRQGHDVDDQLAAAGARRHEDPVPEGAQAGPYGTGQHQHKETALEKELQGETAGSNRPIDDEGGRHPMGAKAAIAGGAAAAGGAALWDEKVGGGGAYGTASNEGYQQAHSSPDQTATRSTGEGARYGGSTFGGPDYPGRQQAATNQQQFARQGGPYHQEQVRPAVVFNDAQQDENEPLAAGGEPRRQRSVLKKKPSKKMTEEERQRRRSSSAEPPTAQGIPEKRRRGSMDAKEHHHRKLHKKRKSVEEGAFAGPQGGPGKTGVPIAYEEDSSPEEYGRGSTEEEASYPQVTRLTHPNEGQETHELPPEERPSAPYGASAWAPAAAEAQRTGQSQKQAPYGTDWRTAGVPASGHSDAGDRSQDSGPDSPTSKNKRKPGLLRKLKGEAKLVSGSLAHDRGKVEQGRLMKEGFVGEEYNPEAGH